MIAMRYVFVSLLVTFMLSGSIPAGASDGAAAHVDVFNTGYRDHDSGTVVTEISAGESITWEWTSGIHTVTSGAVYRSAGDDFDSGSKRAGSDDDSFTFTFEEPGVYAYFCEVHPTMRGVVVVV